MRYKGLKHKVIIRDNQIQFLDGEPDLPDAIVVNVEFSDEEIPAQAEEEHPVTQNILQLMNGLRSKEFDWKEEYHQHLDEKYE